MVFIIHILKRVTGILRKSPHSIIQINKYTFVHTQINGLKKGCVTHGTTLSLNNDLIYYFT